MSSHEFAFDPQAVLAGGAPEQIARHVLDGGEVGRVVLLSDAAFVITEDHVHHPVPVQAVLDAPVARRRRGVWRLHRAR